MATLLHHVKPWMQKSITESEVRMERRMETMMDQKVQDVHKRLDAFELRVFTRPVPVTDLSSIQTELDSLRADLDATIAPPTDELECSLIALADDTKNEQARRASIVDEELGQQRARESIIGDSSSRTTTEAMTAVGDDVSTTDGAVRVTDSTTDGAVIDDVGTTEGYPNVVPVGSGKSELPAC
uniref:Integrase core domain containing protein n=1 Tax=Solanum tuberosum TaxID=4113 RepID=M1E083_SOLTU